jgi:hypothetical protein
MEQEQEKEKRKKQLNTYIKYSGVATQMIVTMCLAAWGGMKLDEHFGVKSHLITVFLLLFSVIASIYFVIQSLTRE